MRPLQSFPSLNALRALEAVARLRSFAKAAEELHVTPGAVSHQIAALESLLGLQLFHRDSRGVAPTTAAQPCLPKLFQGFETLRDAIRLLQIGDASGVLEVGVAPAFAARWLLPRLPRFTAAHPEIELRVSTGLGLIDALRPANAGHRDEVSDHLPSADLDIRFGRGVYPGQQSEKLFTSNVTPVCSPRLMQGPHSLREPSDLRHHLLLHDDTIYFDDDRPDWAVWLEAAATTVVDATRGPRFSHTGLALDAAADGLGVALGVDLLVADEVASGRLVAPFALALPSHLSYYLVVPEATPQRPELTAFAQWLRDEAAPHGSVARADPAAAPPC